MKDSTRKRTIRRLKIVEGQVRGLQRMIEKDIYCVDILHQSAAVKEALSGVENLIFENHLDTHVIEQIKTGEEAKPTREILEIFKLSKKR